METYFDDDGVERCDDCENTVEECDCVCDVCGDMLQDCACEEDE